jgi:hypothetical protein
MKRLAALLLLLCVTAMAAAQTTSVTLQATDADGTQWANGTWGAQLYSPPGVPSGQYVVLGTTTTVPNQTQAGALSATGGASLTVTPNTSISPAGTQWMFTFCSAATPAPCQTYYVTVTGSSQTVAPTLPAIRISMTNPLVRVAAYTDTEITGVGVGTQYFNITVLGLHVCGAATAGVCTNWILASGGGLGTVTSSGYLSGTPLAAFSSSTNITPGTYANVVAAFGSGSCSGYLYSDGTCSIPASTLPSQSGNQGKTLSTNGTSASWLAPTYIDAVEQYGVDNSGGTDTTTAMQNALNACSGNSLYLRDGTYKLSSLTISHACTVFSSNRGAHLLRNSSTTQGNQQAGWIAIASSNVRIVGLEIDGNNGSFTGNCVIASGGYSYIKFLDNWVHNCDQAAWIGEGATQGGPSPSFVEMAGNVWDNTNGNSSGGPTAVGLISFRDASHDVDIHDNPLIDGTYYTYSGGATLQLESQGLTSSMYNFDIHDNPSIRCASNWAIQAGGFNSYELMSIRVVNNGFEAYQDCVGFVSIPVAVTGKIITGNHFNTHFKDLEIQAATGSCTASSNVFSVASGSPFTPVMTGRLLVVPCGASSALIYAYVQYVSASSLNLCSNAIQPGGSCTALNASVSGSSLNWQLWGYSPTYSAIEGGQNQGTVIGNNVFYCETYSSFICINLDGNIDASVTGNTLQGFGEIGGVGIKLATYYQPQTIASISEVGNMVTATVSTTPMTGNIQPGTFVCITTGTPPCSATTSGYQGRVQVLNQNYSRSAGTFSYMVPSTGLSCSSACGSAYFVVTNNVIANNVVHFPSLLPTSGNLFGLSININGATYAQDIFNNSFVGNKVIANNSLAGSVVCFGITGAGAATSVDNTFLKNNDFTGCGTGIVQNIAATNTHLIKNMCTACATIANISSGNIAESDTPLPLADYASCASGLWGNKGITSDGNSATYFVQPGTSGTEDVPIVCIKASNTWVAY